MVTKKIVYFILTGVFMFSCALFEDYPYDKKALTYKNKFVFDNQFRTDGIYVIYYEKDKCWGLRYFFQNGSYFASGTSNEIGLECYQINSKAREIPYAWGYFMVEDNILKVQSYDPGSLNYSTKYRVVEQWAEIVNDTTLHFFKGIDNKGKSSKLDKTFHFRHCANKPDSTNILMRD